MEAYLLIYIRVSDFSPTTKCGEKKNTIHARTRVNSNAVAKYKCPLNVQQYIDNTLEG